MVRPLSRSVLLLPALAVALGVAFGASSRVRAADPLRFVPKEATSLVHLDLAGALAQNLVKITRRELLDLTGAQRELNALKREAGLDVDTGLSTVTFAGTDKAARSSQDSLVILGFRGTPPDAARLAAYYAKRGGTTPRAMPHAGQTVHVIGPDSWFALVDGHALVGDQALVASAMAAAKSGRSAISAALSAVLPPASARRHAWGAAIGSGDLGRLLGRTDPRLKELKTASFTLDLARGLELDVTATLADAPRAEAARAEIAKTFRDIASSPELRELGLEGLSGALSASATGPTLKVRIAITGALATKVSEAVKSLLQ